MISVLVVDDSSLMRKLMREALAGEQETEVQTAPSGPVALSLLSQKVPDLIILDVEMPEMDGLETLRHIRSLYADVPVLMFSSLTEQGAGVTIDALMLGASDYATKPSNREGVAAAVNSVRQQLMPKVRALTARVQRSNAPTLRPGETDCPAAEGPRDTGPSAVEIVAIGSSTGGPNALAEILPRLSVDLPVPVVIVQHMPPVFTRFLAERLNAASPLRVREAQGGERLEPGEVWIAPGDLHMAVRRCDADVFLEVREGPQENSCRPSVDVLFRSVHAAYPGTALGVVLTGMGQDGLLGSQCLASSGSAIVVQDEESSVVWGMPGYVARAGLADKVLPIAAIAAEINGRVERGACLPVWRKG